jgi:hypothetical protein
MSGEDTSRSLRRSLRLQTGEDLTRNPLSGSDSWSDAQETSPTGFSETSGAEAKYATDSSEGSIQQEEGGEGMLLCRILVKQVQRLTT